jgi:pyridoxine 5-phosphate synthase
MALLNVNIDHVATIRQARRTDEPDPAWAAVQCELAGANGITVHLRQDRRHINDRDVRVLKETVACKFNLEMSLAEPIVRIAEQTCPDQVTLVPENRAELTTEGGLDCARWQKRLTQINKRMHRKGILVSAFILPDEKQILASAEAGCDAVELHTGPYANAKTDAAVENALNQLRDGRDIASAAGLIVHAGPFWSASGRPQKK